MTTDLSALIGELRMARRLGRMDVHAGLTTVELRRERLRSAILAADAAAQTVGRGRRARTTFAELFAQVYGELLVPMEGAR